MFINWNNYINHFPIIHKSFSLSCLLISTFVAYNFHTHAFKKKQKHTHVQISLCVFLSFSLTELKKKHTQTLKRKYDIDESLVFFFLRSVVEPTKMYINWFFFSQQFNLLESTKPILFVCCLLAKTKTFLSLFFFLVSFCFFWRFQLNFERMFLFISHCAYNCMPRRSPVCVLNTILKTYYFFCLI